MAVIVTNALPFGQGDGEVAGCRIRDGIGGLWQADEGL